MPSEKYSPFLFSLRVYLRTLSRMSQTTVPSVMGLPSESLQTPFTVPVDWAKTEGTHSPSTRAISTVQTKRFFILPSQANSFMSADFRLQIRPFESRHPLFEICNLKSETAQPHCKERIAAASISA